MQIALVPLFFGPTKIGSHMETNGYYNSVAHMIYPRKRRNCINHRILNTKKEKTDMMMFYKYSTSLIIISHSHIDRNDRYYAILINFT